jgi:RNA polymerase sigma factor (sigma-70 family)
MSAAQDGKGTKRQLYFPSTDWGNLAIVRDQPTCEHRDILNSLIERYWWPIYSYIRRKGRHDADAMDLAQEFFTSCLVKRLFGRADKERGRFRSFLLSCLDNFLANAHRAAYAQKRWPQGGFVSIHNLASGSVRHFEPAGGETPEAVFNRAWASELIMRVLDIFEQECRIGGKDGHFYVFQRRIMKPALEGAEVPPMEVLADELGLTAKQAANRLITARRAFQRLLREEIRQYASSDDELAAEVRDVFDLLAGT